MLFSTVIAYLGVTLVTASHLRRLATGNIDDPDVHSSDFETSTKSTDNTGSENSGYSTTIYHSSGDDDDSDKADLFKDRMRMMREIAKFGGPIGLQIYSSSEDDEEDFEEAKPTSVTRLRRRKSLEGQFNDDTIHLSDFETSSPDQLELPTKDDSESSDSDPVIWSVDPITAEGRNLNGGRRRESVELILRNSLKKKNNNGLANRTRLNGSSNIERRRDVMLQRHNSNKHLADSSATIGETTEAPSTQQGGEFETNDQIVGDMGESEEVSDDNFVTPGTDLLAQMLSVRQIRRQSFGRDPTMSISRAPSPYNSSNASDHGL